MSENMEIWGEDTDPIGAKVGREAGLKQVEPGVSGLAGFVLPESDPLAEPPKVVIEAYLEPDYAYRSARVISEIGMHPHRPEELDLDGNESIRFNFGDATKPSAKTCPHIIVPREFITQHTNNLDICETYADSPHVQAGITPDTRHAIEDARCLDVTVLPKLGM